MNGNLFSGSTDCPRFSRIARSYLLRAAELNWQEINPDIFGSMIQAVADDEERGELGMHYTSVPNILKVLNPLFLDDLREQLEAAGDNVRKLRNLRKRLSTIRVFDPACGSGNFLVIAYIRMREIEHELVKRLDDKPKSWISLSNFYGIEIKDFAAEIARLALLIAEFQCDVRLISQQVARSMVLPLKKTGQIVTGNALRLDWLEVCPPALKPIVEEQDLAGPTGRLALEDNGLGIRDEEETYICGNPPYLGNGLQSADQKQDLDCIFSNLTDSWRSLDYVSGWFKKATEYGKSISSASAFVSTNSICQGQQVPILWPLIFQSGRKISFAYTSFKWANLASYNAGVTVVIVGLAHPDRTLCRLYNHVQGDKTIVREVPEINAYLVPSHSTFVFKEMLPISALPRMDKGSGPVDGGFLMLNPEEVKHLNLSKNLEERLLRPVFGSAEYIRGISRLCLWIERGQLSEISGLQGVKRRIERVADFRAQSPKAATRAAALRAFEFMEKRQQGKEVVLIIPSVSSEGRSYLPVGLLPSGSILTNLAFGLYDAPLWNIALIASRIHLVWIATVCGKMKTDFRYSNTLGWNTFPVPPLTERNKTDLTRCAEDILLAREAHFPKTIADLYDPENMPDDLRRAHERNDETLERIYIGRRFRNDTERLEKLFDLYTKMTEGKSRKKGAA